jgi:hypothetical protein
VSTPPEEGSEETRSPYPYNFVFALVAIGVAVVAFLLTMLLFRNLFEDFAVVTGTLGTLFTLIGTVTGAYFGIKRSSDTEDKARVAERMANERVEEANRTARNAAGALDPDEWRRLRDQKLL